MVLSKRSWISLMTELEVVVVAPHHHQQFQCHVFHNMDALREESVGTLTFFVVNAEMKTMMMILMMMKIVIQPVFAKRMEFA